MEMYICCAKYLTSPPVTSNVKGLLKNISKEIITLIIKSMNYIQFSLKYLMNERLKFKVLIGLITFCPLKTKRLYRFAMQ